MILVFLSILASAIYYLGSRLVVPLDLQGWPRLAAWTLLTIPFALIFWLPVIRWNRESEEGLGELDEFFQAAAFFAAGTVSFALLGTVLRDLFAWALLRTLGSDFYNQTGTLAILAFGGIAYSIAFFKSQRPQILKVLISVEGLAKQLDGITIAQVSDLHLGVMIREKFVQNVVSQINQLSPDLVALTGDIGDGDPARLEPELKALSGLRARSGIFYVLGNHEGYWDAETWVMALKKIGAIVLLNSHLRVKFGRDSLAVVGVTDSKPDPRKALDGLPPDLFRLILCHQPKHAPEISKLTSGLQLSGHTHGGQFFPWTVLSKLLHRQFHAGLSRIGQLQVYVNRGTGYWGPPARLGSAPEITLITLRTRK